MPQSPAYPGFYITLRETGLVAVTPDQPTDRLLIIAPAVDGPSNTPIPVNSPAEAERIFGPTIYRNGYINPVTGVEDGAWNGNLLVRAAGIAFANGAANVLLMRVGGKSASVTGVLTGSITGSYNIDLVALAPGRIYNSVTVSSTLSGGMLRVTINQPLEKGGTVQYVFPQSTPLGNVLNQINSDNNNRTVVFLLSSASPSGLSALSLPCSGMTFNTVALSGTTTGSNGTRVQGEDYANSVTGLYQLLIHPVSGAFQVAKEYTFDVAVVDGVYADDNVANSPSISIYDVFADFILEASRNHPCHGVLGLKPIPYLNMAQVRSYVEENYLATTNGYVSNTMQETIKFGPFILDGGTIVDSNTGESVQTGRQVSVVAGLPVVMNDRVLGDFIDTPHVAFAARVAAETPGRSFVYYPMPSIKSTVLRHFPADLTRRLVDGVGKDRSTNNPGGGGYIVIRSLPYLNNQIAVVSDPTTARRDHSYSTLGVARTVNAAVRLVKSAVSPFIGQPNRVEVHSAIATAIRGVLNRLVEAGALLGGEGIGYRFSIIPFGPDLQLGEIRVVLDLVPSISIRAVRIEVNVTL